MLTIGVVNSADVIKFLISSLTFLEYFFEPKIKELIKLKISLNSQSGKNDAFIFLEIFKQKRIFPH